MEKCGTAVLLAVVGIVASGCSAAFPASAGLSSTSLATAPSTDTREPGSSSSRIHITVSGPYDTRMRVSRGGTETDAELLGEPFDFEFTEKDRNIGELDIAVFAKSDDPAQEPLRCSITVNGETVAEESTSERGDRGHAEVACVMPRNT